MSSAALTVHADVTNNSDAPQAGVVTAAITPPGGGDPIQVSQPVTLLTLLVAVANNTQASVNDGYAATSGPVTFTADVPAGLTPVSITAGGGWSCALATATCTTKDGVRLAAGEQDVITLVVAVSPDAPPSAETLLRASGGGEIPAAAIDENNDYSTVSNGGSFVAPTYIAASNST